MVRLIHGLKVDSALSKWNFLFHLKSKRNLVTLVKRNSHVQHYKIDLSFSIKLEKITSIMSYLSALIHLNTFKFRYALVLTMYSSKRTFFQFFIKNINHYCRCTFYNEVLHSGANRGSICEKFLAFTLI